MIRHVLLLLFVELLVFAVSAVACSFALEVHQVAAFVIGGLFALLIRVLLLIGTVGAARLLRMRAVGARPGGQVWKRHGSWGEWRK